MGGLSTPEGQSWHEGLPPILIMHGGADSSVTLDDVTTLAGELEGAGAAYTIEIYSNAPHGFTEFGTDTIRSGRIRPPSRARPTPRMCRSCRT